MKKILIYYPEDKLLPKGGPSGYLYNLRSGISNIKNKNIEISFYKNERDKIEDNQVLRDNIPNFLKDIRRVWKFSHYLGRKYRCDENLFKYDAIHFHNTEDVYMNRDVLKDYEGKVILTTHTPCAPYLETISRINSRQYSFFKHQLDKLEEMDIYAFTRADFIIFPCSEAEQPYYNTWPKYKTIREPHKIRYMATGINKCTAKISRKEIREKYKIPSDAFLISYVGRHNEIKGYGDLKKMGEILLKDDDIYFLIAGKEAPMKGVSHPRWIEVGWTKDPHSLIAASDVFLLPNKETYFDLVLLEVISLGIPLVISNTGGNRYFSRFNLEGIKIYDDLDDAYKKIYQIKNMDLETKRHLSYEINDLFEREFTIREFAQRYYSILEGILNE